MKGIDIFCASQAATSIRLSTTHIMDSSSDIVQEPSSSSSSAAAHLGGGYIGGRAIDRHNPIIQDEKRLGRPLIPPSSSSSSSSSTTTTTQPHHHKKASKAKNIDQKRKGIAFADENENEDLINIENTTFTTTTTIINNFKAGSSSSSGGGGGGGGSGGVRKQVGVLGWGCTRPGDFISPATSSRYLLSDKALVNAIEFDPLLKVVPAPAPPPEKPSKSHDGKGFVKKKDDDQLSSAPPKPPPSSSSSSSSSSSRRSSDQVVVLKVSLHCRGCERKMRKHISKMEGVTSFDIDFAAKKVTVVGDVTPLAVLTSISKVKNAKLLTPTTVSSSSAPPTDTNFIEIKKQLGIVV